MKTIEICSGWKLHWGSTGQGENEHLYTDEADDLNWIRATVPGDVRIDLLREGMIEEPLEGTNIREQKWIEEKEWWYKTAFEIESIPPGSGYELVFHGLDLESSIWLNGEKIGNTKNMFIPHRFDITPYLKEGRNIAAVRLIPAVASLDGADIERYGGVDGEYYAQRCFSRKAQFTFGWDWAPHLLTCGIWRSVELTEHKGVLMQHTYVETQQIDSEGAHLKVRVELENKLDKAKEYKLYFKMDDMIFNIEGLLNPGTQELSFQYLVQRPKLWWPLGVGEAYLYNVTFELLLPGEDIHLTKTARCGIRMVELLEEPIAEEEGKSFTLVVNGEKIYCKGANWVPLDSVIGRIPKDMYKDRLNKAADAHINMLRVWGGGFYEDPYFYRLCDELGIMVWQDFMFACAWYPDDNEGFMENVAVEAESVLKQLRSHPSIVLWCGNNENDQVYYLKHHSDDPFWERFMPVDRFYGEKIYHQLLPSLCRKYVPTIPYRPSSPFGGVNPNGTNEGDCHSWGVSVIDENNPERIAYKDFDKDKTKFCSEFGIMSPPGYDTLCRYLPEDQRYINSPAWKFHANRMDPDSNQGKQMIRNYWCDLEELTLKDYSIVGQILQAEVYKFAWEHYRRRKFSCSGTLFWMMCDSWGAQGWSVIDYFGIPKASYHYLRRAYRPVLLSFRETHGGMELWVANDHLHQLECKISFSFVLFDGTVYNQKEMDCRIPSNVSIKLEILDKPDASLFRKGYFYAEIRTIDGIISDNRYFPDSIKNMEFPVPTIHSRWVEDEKRLELKSDVFAYCVYLDGVHTGMSDNYFDLYPGRVKSIYVEKLELEGQTCSGMQNGYGQMMKDSITTPLCFSGRK